MRNETKANAILIGAPAIASVTSSQVPKRNAVSTEREMKNMWNALRDILCKASVKLVNDGQEHQADKKDPRQDDEKVNEFVF